MKRETVKNRLTATMWQTAAQIVDDLRQCGPLAFADDAEFREFHYATAKRQYRIVYAILQALRKSNEIDAVLGE